MRFLICGAVLVSICLVSSGFGAKFPSTFKKCRKTDNKCLTKAIENAIQQLDHPMPEVGLPNVLPFVITSMEVAPKANGPVSIRQKFTNAKIYGFESIYVRDGQFDFEKGVFTVQFSAHMKIEADYELEGRVLVLPVTGKGDSVITIENVDANAILHFKRFAKNGRNYLAVSDGRITMMEPSRVTFRFNNLFNGNKDLGDNVNQLLNDNWKEVYAEVKKEYEGIISQLFYTTARAFFSRVPENDIFED